MNIEHTTEKIRSPEQLQKMAPPPGSPDGSTRFCQSGTMQAQAAAQDQGVATAEDDSVITAEDVSVVTAEENAVDLIEELKEQEQNGVDGNGKLVISNGEDPQAQEDPAFKQIQSNLMEYLQRNGSTTPKMKQLAKDLFAIVYADPYEHDMAATDKENYNVDADRHSLENEIKDSLSKLSDLSPESQRREMFIMRCFMEYWHPQQAQQPASQTQQQEPEDATVIVLGSQIQQQLIVNPGGELKGGGHDRGTKPMSINNTLEPATMIEYQRSVCTLKSSTDYSTGNSNSSPLAGHNQYGDISASVSFDGAPSLLDERTSIDGQSFEGGTGADNTAVGDQFINHRRAAPYSQTREPDPHYQPCPTQTPILLLEEQARLNLKETWHQNSKAVKDWYKDRYNVDMPRCAYDLEMDIRHEANINRIREVEGVMTEADVDKLKKKELEMILVDLSMGKFHLNKILFVSRFHLDLQDGTTSDLQGIFKTSKTLPIPELLRDKTGINASEDTLLKFLVEYHNPYPIPHSGGANRDWQRMKDTLKVLLFYEPQKESNALLSQPECKQNDDQASIATSQVNATATSQVNALPKSLYQLACNGGSRAPSDESVLTQRP